MSSSTNELYNFRDSTDEKLQYFRKLIPDFSIFDKIEKFMIENNKPEGEFGLFYYKSSASTIDIITTHFKRAVFRAVNSGNIESAALLDADSINKDHTYSYDIFINNCHYIILIDDSNTISFKFAKPAENVIGVCF